MDDPTKIIARNHGVPKLTKERLDLVIAAIEAGHIREDAAAMAGVSRATLYAWIDEGEAALQADDRGEPLDERNTVLCAFVLRYQQAIAKRTLLMMQRLSSTESNAVVSATTWQLTQFRRKEFTAPQRVEVSGKDGGSIEHTATVRVIALPPLEDAADEDRSAVEGEPRPAVALPVVGSR
jgi:hypothetical protein